MAVFHGGRTVRIILSRKGFDSASGGCPSPIIDGRPLSLPIPTRQPTVTRYRDLSGPYAALVTDLTKDRLTGDSPCHTDPDLIHDTLPRAPGWRGALGQIASSQGHLAKHGVGAGDLFLFWGLFRPVAFDGRWRFTGKPEHRIWGWLQIEDVITLGIDGSHAEAMHPWLKGHPHVSDGWSRSNTLYVATPRLRINGAEMHLPGYGVFPAGLRLTADEPQLSIWRAPDWLHPQSGGCGMTYHPTHRWGADGNVRSAGRGQEFIAAPDGDPRAISWLNDLFAQVSA